MRRTILATLVSVPLWVQFAHGHGTQAVPGAPAPVSLLPERPVERVLAGEQEHGYQITLAEGRQARVVVDQRGIDVVVQLSGTDGQRIADFDLEVRTWGREEVEVVAERGGVYQIVVKARYPRLPAGRYEIRVAGERDATAEDRAMQESRALQTESKRLIDAGKYAEALPLAEKSLDLRERIRGSEHVDLYLPLINLFYIRFRRGEYARAEEYGLRALAITERSWGGEHPLVGRLLYNLGVLYSFRGDDDRAEPLLWRAIAIHEKTLDSDHPYVAHSVNWLAVILKNRGDYAHAEPLFRRALVITERSLGEEHEDVANAVNTLASVYHQTGDYGKAEPLYRRALAIIEKARGPEHSFLAPLLNNLANNYRDMGDYEKAEPLYLRAIELREKAVGPEHPDAAGSRCGLAYLHFRRGDYAKSKALYESALTTLEKALGPRHPLVGWHTSNLANVFAALGDSAKAETLYRRAVYALETGHGANYYLLADPLTALSKLSLAEGNMADAVALQTRANSVVEYNLGLNLAVGSERQKLAYLARLPEQMNQAIALHVGFAGEDAAARELSTTAILQGKGRVLDAVADSLARMRERSNAADQALLDKLRDATSRLAALALAAPQRTISAELQKRIQTLTAEREELEDRVSRSSAGYHERSSAVTLSAIQAAIPAGATLVEFAVYRPFDPGALFESRARSSAPRYVVYVVPGRGAVRWKDLGPAAEIDAAVRVFLQALRDPARRDVRQAARNLDEKVMRPVRALVGEPARLLVSPDGQLDLIPFEALIDELGRYLVETWSVSYLTAGRDLLRLERAPRRPSSGTLVLADPVFGVPDDPGIANARFRNAPKRSITTGEDLQSVYFAPLTGTAEEARAIRSLFPHARLLTGAQATEAALKRAEAPRILHIATHGFFLGDFASRIENPLLRSGLALTGANLSKGSGEDGILTALEAANLNLWGTRLVTLSACDTGVGEVKIGEGVYGLRRAFVLAGAETLVMSLWPVSDRVTREMMTAYYQGLKKGAGRGEALRQAQLAMLRRKGREHPFYWASFIQSGEWANLEGQR